MVGYHLTVFLTQIISPWQKNANAKVVFSILRQQKWNLDQQFPKICIFPNIQLKGVVNRLSPFKNLSDHTNIFLMGFSLAPLTNLPCLVNNKKETRQWNVRISRSKLVDWKNVVEIYNKNKTKLTKILFFIFFCLQNVSKLLEISNTLESY